MTPSLPPHPSLENLKKQAKSILKAHKAGDPSCYEVLRKLSRFAEAPDAEILAADIPLKEVQFALAMHYGFRSWAEMRQVVGNGKGNVVGAMRAFSDIKFQGNVCSEDSYSVIMTAVAELMGRDVVREQIAMLSTNPFTPGIRLDEACTSWWHVQAADCCMDLEAGLIGFDFERVPDVDHSQDPPYPESKIEADKWLRDYYRKPYAGPIAQALAAGKIIVIPREWDWSRGNGWYGWGIIVEVRDNGVILGACLNGRNDNALRSAGQAVILSLSEPTLSGRAANVRMLDRALHRIRGDMEPFVPTENYVFGIAAMEAWIEHMRTTQGFCAECFERAPERVWTDANDNGMVARDGAMLVSSYMRGRFSHCDALSRSHLESVAVCYDRIAELLTPAVTGQGGPHYKEFIGDLDKQKAHADNVLVPIKAELAVAADEIERALVAMGGQR